MFLLTTRSLAAPPPTRTFAASRVILSEGATSSCLAVINLVRLSSDMILSRISQNVIASSTHFYLSLMLLTMMARRYLYLPFLAILLPTTCPVLAFVPSMYRKSTRISPKAPFLFLSQEQQQQDAFPMQQNENELPANLRRKVRAKRPPRGHVIPRHTKVKGSGGSSNPRLRPQGKAREAGLNNPSNIKIIGGSARGRRLDSPQVYLRPMMGKVREAVFSTLTSFGLYDASAKTRHLDIFAGSGSVGLESLSRGARECTFVDFAQDCCNAIERNIKWCQFDNEQDYTTQVVCSDYLVALRQPESVGISTTRPYNVITLSPPYEEVTYAELLEAVVNSRLVGQDTIVVIEYPTELGTLPHVVSQENGGGAMIGVRNRKYGRTVIAMYIVNPSGNMEVANSRPEEFVEL